jgi:hypothetical protein
MAPSEDISVLPPSEWRTAQHGRSLHVLEYSVRRKPFRSWDIPSIAFGCGSGIAGFAVSLAANHKLDQYNSYLGREFSFGLDCCFIAFFSLAASAILCAGFWVVRRFRPVEGLSWAKKLAIIGFLHGILVYTPEVIDVATSSGKTLPGGNLEAQGWGGTVGPILFILGLVLLVIFFGPAKRLIPTAREAQMQ